MDFSAFDRTHRIAAALSCQHEWFPGCVTTFGMIYTGISGIPYSYVSVFVLSDVDCLGS